MKSNRFWTIALLMSGALIGLILLQVYWLRHDLEVREQQFGQTVMSAMTDIVDDVEQKENMKLVVKHYMTSGDSSWSSTVTVDSDAAKTFASLVPPPPPPGPQAVPPPPGVNEIEAEINEQIARFRGSNRMRSNDRDAGWVTDTSTLDIRIEKDVQQKEVYAIRLAHEEACIDSMARETEKRMQSRLRRLDTMMQKYTLQIGNRYGNIFERVDSLTLDSIIRDRLRSRKIELPYNFAITDTVKGRILYLFLKSDTMSVDQSAYRISLFPNDFVRRNEELILSFPGKFNYLLSGMWMLLAASIIFTCVMIFGFFYTMRTILRQKKLAEIKNDFINNMTHEFKTPIATIAVATQSIRDPRVYGSVEKLEYFADVIRDENQRMLNQVENVLQMAQIDKGELVLKKEHIDLNELVDQSVASVSLPVEQRGGTIHLDATAQFAAFYGDPGHLMNVFTNLLDNANKYSPQTPVIRVRTANKEQFWQVTISDEGIGMSKETQKRIFEPFYRATSGNIHDVKGFGLGLSYVKAIVEAHGGSISVSSEFGKGSEFTIQFPC